MKRFRFIMASLFGLLLFGIVGATLSHFNVHAFIDAPIPYLVDQFSDPSGVIIASMSISAITWDDGNENMGGFKPYIAVIPTSYIEDEAVLKKNPSTDDEKVTLVGSHVLVAGKYWKKVYATTETVKYTPENQGETDGQSFRQKGEFSHPGSSNAINAFARDVNNGNFIVMFFEENGERVQIGSVSHPARFKISPDFGAKASDKKHNLFSIEADSKVAYPRYIGDVVFSETITESYES